MTPPLGTLNAKVVRLCEEKKDINIEIGGNIQVAREQAGYTQGHALRNAWHDAESPECY